MESYEVPAQESDLVLYPVAGDVIGDPFYLTVPADQQDEQTDLASQQEIWNYFTSLIPKDDRKFLTQYTILTDGPDNLLAAVSQSHSDPSLWTLEVDVADSQNYEDLTFTLIHEFGHLLTLNTDQVTPNLQVFNHPNDQAVYNQEAASCSTYFPGEGCSQPDSYINLFYQRFWQGKYPEWNQVDSIHDDNLYYEKLSEFYETYRDEFVSNYAATNPGEDIAESWTYFVLTPKPQGTTVAEQKVLFFYEFPELVELREEILGRVCSSFPSP